MNTAGMLERSCEILLGGLLALVDAAIAAGLLAGAVVCVLAALGRWLTPAQRALLWGLVLVRLLMPTGPESSFSLRGLAMAAQPRLPLRSINSALGVPYTTLVASPPAYVPQPRPLPAPDATTELDWLILFEELAPLALVVGGGVILFWSLLRQWRFSRRVARAGVCEEAAVLDLWRACCRETDVAPAPDVVIFDGVRQPAVMGAWRPRLLLPADVLGLDEHRLRLVMLHELAHIRRRDLLWNWVLMFARAAHWWNPVCWLSSWRFNALREQACDAFVLARLQPESRRDYGELLIELAQRTPPACGWTLALPSSLLGLLPYWRRTGLRGRLRAIQRAAVPATRRRTACFALLCAVVAACGLTEAESIPRNAGSEPGSVQAAEAKVWEVAPTPAQPAVSRSYELSQALQAAARVELGPNYSPESLEKLLSNNLRGIVPRDFNPDAAMQMELDGDTLVVSTTEAIHAEIPRLLEVLGQGGFAHVTVECRVIASAIDLAKHAGVVWRAVDSTPAQWTGELPPGGAEDAGVRGRVAVEEYTAFTQSLIDEPTVSRLMEAARDGAQTTLLTAPKVTVSNAQRASIESVSRRPFVVAITQIDGTAVPTVRVIDEGFRLAVRPELDRNEPGVHLDVGLLLTSIESVEVTTAAIAGEERAIQTPTVHSCTVTAATHVPTGRSLLVGCVQPGEARPHNYFLFTPRMLPAE